MNLREFFFGKTPGEQRDDALLRGVEIGRKDGLNIALQIVRDHKAKDIWEKRDEPPGYGEALAYVEAALIKRIEG